MKRLLISLVPLCACGYIFIESPMVAAEGNQAKELSAERRREQQIAERFLSILQKNPRRGTALDRVYGYHVENGSLDDYVKSLQSKTQKQPDDGDTWMILGLLESQRGRDAAAIQAFRQAEKHLSDNALPCYYLGQSLVLVGRPEQAAEAFSRAIDRKPSRNDLLEIFEAYGRVYQRAQQHEKALAVWDRLEKLFPEDSRVKEQIAATLADEGQHAEALKRYEALAKTTKDLYRQVTFRIEVADLKLRLGKSKDALSDFESLLGQLNPESWLFRDVRGRIEDVFLDSDDLDGLSKYYEDWIKKHPDDVEAMTRLARTLSLQGRSAEARQWYEKAVKLAPSQERLRLGLIEQLVEDRQYSEAVRQYKELDKLIPNNTDYVRAWGRLILQDSSLKEADRNKKAAAVWQRLVTARPMDPVTATQVADLLRQIKLSDEAIALYRKAVELSSESPQYREYLGEYLHTLKRPEEAVSVWSQIVQGDRRTVENLVRLAEIFAGFGYADEAIEAQRSACDLEPEHFGNRLKYSQLLQSNDDFDAAMQQVKLAAKLAESDEEKEAALDQELELLSTTGKLPNAIIATRKEIAAAGKNATALQWYRLARELFAGRQLAEAKQAVSQSLAKDDGSIRGWLAGAKIYEASGDLASAAKAQRKLALIDRRFRTDHLTEVANLELRLGRFEEAVKAGEELIADAPGNPQHYEFFANLNFQIGNTKAGFESLRRSVRTNPSEPELLMKLAARLGEFFHTDEAIEIYWRAFEKSQDVETKLSVVTQLAELYLRINQHDRLVERLRRGARETDRRREMTLCLATAYSAAGDYDLARAELESLLTEQSRDNELLRQLSQLSERGGDWEAAAKYQIQVNDIAPSQEGNHRLAKLYLAGGEQESADALFQRIAQEKADGQTGRFAIIQSVDNLMAGGNYAAVLPITERLLRENPGDWEVLYREAVVLVKLDRKSDALERFQALLKLPVEDDERGIIGKRAFEQRQKQSASSSKRSTFSPPPSGYMDRKRVYSLIRHETGMDAQYYYGSQPSWKPQDFGQARMAAVAWQYKIAGDESTEKQEAFLADLHKRVTEPNAGPRTMWLLYYLETVRRDQQAVHKVARLLSNDPAPEGQHSYLMSLVNRVGNGGQYATQGFSMQQGGTDSVPPLPDKELDHILNCFDTVIVLHPEWVGKGTIGNTVTELKRAGRDDDAARVLRTAMENANRGHTLNDAIAIAGREGEIDVMLKLFDKLERLRGNSVDPAVERIPTTRELADVMNSRANAKAHPDILRILDRYLLSRQRFQRVLAGTRGRNSSRSGAYNSQISIQITTGGRSNYIQIDYPKANHYFDEGGIQLLRAAYEYYRRDDLLSDLFDHFQKQTKLAEENQQLHAHLALCYLHWWNNEKVESAEELAKAAKLAPGDMKLRLELARIQEQNGDHREALALIDQVEPLDYRVMQERETYALYLAVVSGNVPRAKKAAERLFGLRLDTDTQLQLAQQMHQLGMHEMSEAVLTRTRRKSGNRMGTLVSLMQQFTQQGKGDVAVHVAHQILRRARPAQASTAGYSNSDESAVQQAVQTLARSNKLDEVIARLEKQLENSPNSLPLHQKLISYYRASSKKDKAREMQKRILELRPQDMKLRYQMAQEMAQLGDNKAAVEQYLVVLKKEPALLGRNFYSVQRAFQQADKTEEFVKALESIDLKSMGHYYTVTNIVQQLVQNKKTQTQGLKLFRRAWESFPNNRMELVQQIAYIQQVWELPEMYDYALAAVIPPANRVGTDPWAGLTRVMSYGHDGKATGVVNRLLSVAKKQGKTADLKERVTARVKEAPGWIGGRALLAVLDAREGKTDEVRRVLEEIYQNKQAPASGIAMWLIAVEIEEIKELQELSVKLLEYASKNTSNHVQQWEISPARRLVSIYKKAGRKREARDLLLEGINRPSNQNYYDPGYQAYQYLNTRINAARELVSLGYPADAVILLNAAAGDTTRIQASEQFSGGRFKQQLEQGLSQALKNLNSDALVETLRDLTSPKADRSSTEDKPSIELVMLVQPRELNKASVTSMLQVALQSAHKDKKLLAEVDSNIDKLAQKDAEDFSVAIAAALLAFTEKDTEKIRVQTAALKKLIQVTPLEELPENGVANSRLRAAAKKQLGLWLVAREAWKHDSLAATAQLFEDRALEAARRQTDPSWVLAMFRELGEQALERGDRGKAEEYWSRMLEMILMDPKSKSSTKKVSHKTETPRLRPVGAIFSVRELLAASAFGQYAAKVWGDSAGSTVVTSDRFEQAMQVARMAAEHDFFDLSLRAVRGALANGPPVTPQKIGQNGRSRRINPAQANQQLQQSIRQIEMKLAEMDRIWVRKKVPAEKVYETLAAIVFPQSRSTEIFLYPRPLNVQPTSDGSQPSAGRTLITWAIKAQQVDDLKSRVEQRTAHSTSMLSGHILLTQLALENKDFPEANRQLKLLSTQLKKETLQHSSEQACHAALPALNISETSDAALELLQQAAGNLNKSNSEQPLAGILLKIAKQQLKRKKTKQGKASLERYLQELQKMNVRYGGDYGLVRRREQLATAGKMLIREGQLDAGLEYLGHFTDIPINKRYSRPAGIGDAASFLARQLLEVPPQRRYELLKTWTLPTDKRKSVRILITSVPYETPPAAFAPTVEGIQPGGQFRLAGDAPLAHIFSTATLLVDTAAKLGKLHELTAQLKTLVDQDVENAPELFAVAALASGQSEAARPIAEKIAQEVAERVKSTDYNQLRNFQWSHFLVALACLKDDSLWELGEQICTDMSLQAKKSGNRDLLPHAWRGVAVGRASRAGVNCDGRIIGSEELLWTPATQTDFRKALIGLEPATWAVQDGMIRHLGGSDWDFLYFRYPLTGNFEFSAVISDANYGEGHLTYGGLIYRAEVWKKSGGPYLTSQQTLSPNPAPYLGYGFNRISIRVTPQSVEHRINGHLFYKDDSPSPISPWLGLYCLDKAQTVFKDLKLTGDVQIPREVSLTSGNRLEGWTGTFYGESLTPRVEKDADGESKELKIMGRALPAEQQGEIAWTAHHGEIHGRRIEEGSSSEPQPSRLYYTRALHNGEQIHYQFFYQPGQFTVHPTIGRLAFLLDPAGVRLHWMTLDEEKEWTGLPADNAIDEPNNRLHNGQLPLKQGEWNSVKISLKNDTVFIDLNGQPIYSRALEKSNDRLFGFFNFKNQSAAKVRKVMLSGDWPVSLSDAQLADLTAPVNERSAPNERSVLSGIIGEFYYSTQTSSVLKKARGMTPKQRYAFLSEWVLPGETHSDYRVSAVPATGQVPGSIAGKLESPAVELVAEAVRLGQLDKLAMAVQAVKPSNDNDRRRQTVLLVLIQIAAQDDKAAAASLKHLSAFAKSADENAPAWTHWPEIIAGTVAIERPALHKAVDSLLENIKIAVSQNAYSADHIPGGHQLVSRYLSGLRSRILTHDIIPETAVALADSSRSSNWQPAHDTNEQLHGEGEPPSAWLASNDAIYLQPGHGENRLYWRSPLQGDFQVEAELLISKTAQTAISYAGLSILVHTDGREFTIRRGGKSIPGGTITPPLKFDSPWQRAKLVVQDGKYSFFLGDQKISQQPLPTNPAPWLAIESVNARPAGVRQFKIEGLPEVPQRVSMSGGDGLSAWLTDYYHRPAEASQDPQRSRQTSEEKTPAWELNSQVIVGRKFENPPTDHIQSLIQYRRPISGEGTVEYEFYYEPDSALVHPVLGRTAFMLAEKGIGLHRLTDGRFERTGLLPDNRRDEPAGRPSTGPLSLKAKEWNHLSLSVAGETVTLELNGEIIIQHPIEHGNDWKFGLFHYSDRTEARVRNVSYQSRWPKNAQQARNVNISRRTFQSVK